MKKSLIAISFAVATLGACTSPPVHLDTVGGPVECQLFTSDIVLLDKATMKPATMTQSQADSYCRAEGHKRAIN